MLILEPQPSPYDLQWRMFGTYVRVHPLFWLVSALLGWSIAQREGLAYLAVWILCSFVSILLHEFGHIGMGRLFGQQGHIVLYGMGGLAVGIHLDNRWKRIAVSFAGPLAQFVLLGGVLGIVILLAVQGVRLQEGDEFALLGYAALNYLFFINLYWPLLNLLPIWPLDGGRISRDLFDWLAPQRGVRLSLGISFLLAGLLASYALIGEFQKEKQLIPYLPTGIYAAVLFGMLAVGSFQAMQMESDPPWKRYDPD